MKEQIIDIIIAIEHERWKPNQDLMSEREGYITRFNSLDIIFRKRSGNWNPYLMINGIDFINNNKLDDLEEKLNKHFAEIEENRLKGVIENIYKTLTL